MTAKSCTLFCWQCISEIIKTYLPGATCIDSKNQIALEYLGTHTTTKARPPATVLDPVTAMALTGSSHFAVVVSRSQKT